LQIHKKSKVIKLKEYEDLEKLLEAMEQQLG
jgi:hypothetical protein